MFQGCAINKFEIMFNVNKCEDGGEKYPDHGKRAVKQQRGPWTFIMQVPWRHVPDARLVTGRVFSGRQPPQPSTPSNPVNGAWNVLTKADNTHTQRQTWGKGEIGVCGVGESSPTPGPVQAGIGYRSQPTAAEAAMRRHGIEQSAFCTYLPLSGTPRLLARVPSPSHPTTYPPLSLSHTHTILTPPLFWG